MMSWASFFGEKDKEEFLKLARERAKPPLRRRIGKLVRKAGPGIGGLVGAGIGAAMGRKGKMFRKALAGLGAGATLGWVPSMAHEAKKAIKEFRRGK
jgi:hypothetical protein